MIDSVLYCLFNVFATFLFLKIFTCFTYYINVLYVWTDSTMSCIQFYVLSRRLVLTLSPSLTPILPTVLSTEYPQSGNGHFLACIPS